MERYAHTREGEPPERWQKLEDHLRQVATRAAEFASCFGASSWAGLAGLWHDLGKYDPEFQRYLQAASEASLETRPGKVNHSTAGGQLAIERFGNLGRLLAYPIAGHHAGLPDWQSDSSPLKSLSQRLSRAEHLLAARSGDIPSLFLE